VVALAGGGNGVELVLGEEDAHQSIVFRTAGGDQLQLTPDAPHPQAVPLANHPNLEHCNRKD